MRRANRIETVLILVVLLTACDDSSGVSTPTAPAELTAAASAFWLGEITLDAAWPAGHCVVDGLLADPADKVHGLRMESSPPGPAFWARLYTSHNSADDFYFNPYQAFLPSKAYTGGLDTEGTLSLTRSFSGEEFVSTSKVYFCTDAWARTDGWIVGEISTDGTWFRGELFETFRTLQDGSIFTVHWRFDLARKSEADSF